ncbi:YwqI/YxiC family protein [Bacillus sp. IB182487]|uniref:YwqI/YxiC family protein n=1 Tax=Metabacillus arenae TaxID=2771434 RepID=A0A926NGM6_9BACI|nr:YwqI/YxiC family protein [Metabacillus arenae]
MSEEMKIRYGEVESAISKIESSAGSFETSLLKEIAGGNELDVVNKLNELNNLLEEVGEAYKQVLKANNQSVRTTIESIKEADHNIGSSIRAR